MSAPGEERWTASDLVCVTVTYDPDPSILQSQLRSLPEEALKVVVDNASPHVRAEDLQHMASEIPCTHLILRSQNEGLPAALNHGVEISRAIDPTRQLVLLLDQDSEPQAGSIQILLDALSALQRAEGRVGAVGPRLVDVATGLQHGFHQPTRWRWRRVYPLPTDSPVPCATLNGSGTLMPLDIFQTLGGLDASLFIDHVDTEWSFRLRAAGYCLYGIPHAEFLHRMGATSTRFWMLGWKVWPSRSPVRHYYLFRNAVRLMRCNYVPVLWKVWAVAKLAVTFFVVALIGPDRLRQWCQMGRGVGDGLRRRRPLP